MILVSYRHGLRASELVDLRWDQIDFATATLHVRRVKQGSPSTHPIHGDELRMLRRLQREQEPKSPFVFTSERGSPFTTAGFARMVERAGWEAKFGFKAHPHMLRHACGSPLRQRATIPAPFRLTSGTRTSSTPCAIPSCPLPASKTSGGLDRALMTAQSMLSRPCPGEGNISEFGSRYFVRCGNPVPAAPNDCHLGLRSQRSSRSLCVRGRAQLRNLRPRHRWGPCAGSH